MSSKVTLNGSYYTLTRMSDGAGDSGPMFNCISPEGKIVGERGEIRLGHAVQCGSFTGRTFAYQDWWLTSLITEIIHINEDKTEVVFRTLNSNYTATAR